MLLYYDAPTTQTNVGAAHVLTLPQGTPVATDSIVFINPTNGAQLMPFSALGGSSGAGTPEASVTASPGATYWDTTDKLFYVKDTGTGNTGWLAING